MSLFDGRQPAMFDVRRRVGNVEKTDEADSAPESWVELAPSRASLCSSDAMVFVDSDVAPGEGSTQSPLSVLSPHVELEPNLEQVKYQLARHVSPGNTDWIWDWSSRPEAIPPRSSRKQPHSTLSTPPNSPQPSACSEYRSSSRLYLIFGLFFSNVVTFIIGAAIGFCVCKKLVRSNKQL